MRHKSLLLVFPAMIWVLLFGGADAWATAAIDPPCGNGIYPADALGTCIQTNDYVLRIDGGIVGNAKTPWPIPQRDADGNVTGYEYRYRLGVLTTCKDTVNYVLMDLPVYPGSTQVDYITGTVPGGAQLFLSGINVSSKCSFSAGKGFDLMKLNPGLNCNQGFTEISIYTNQCTQPQDSNMVILTKSGCAAPFYPAVGGNQAIPNAPILLPSPNVAPQQTHKEWGEGAVTVEFDRCTQVPKTVTFKVPDPTTGVLSTVTTCRSDSPGIIIGVDPKTANFLSPFGDADTGAPPLQWPCTTVTYTDQTTYNCTNGNFDPYGVWDVKQISETVLLQWDPNNPTTTSNLFLWGTKLWFHLPPAGTPGGLTACPAGTVTCPGGICP